VRRFDACREIVARRFLIPRFGTYYKKRFIRKVAWRLSKELTKNKCGYCIIVHYYNSKLLNNYKNIFEHLGVPSEDLECGFVRSVKPFYPGEPAYIVYINENNVDYLITFIHEIGHIILNNERCLRKYLHGVEYEDTYNYVNKFDRHYTYKRKCNEYYADVAGFNFVKSYVSKFYEMFIFHDMVKMQQIIQYREQDILFLEEIHENYERPRDCNLNGL
jgi:hypothetical protein